MSLEELRPKPSVLVVGAGLAGMIAAHHLAEWGAQVTLADRAPHLGGRFLLLDHTFTTDSCGLCLALPRQPSYCPTIASELDPRIALLPCTTLGTLEGKSGDFVATLHRAPSYVDPSRCDNCGACATVCPAPQSDLTHPQQKAIYPPPPRAVPFVYAIDPDACTRCGACVSICPREAIDLEATSTEGRIEVDAVVLSPGSAPFDAARAVEYGWGRYPNVVTSLELERMLNLSGPTGGRPLRPSDRQPPRRIAFIHCVGSRNERLGRPYCSTSCCMIAAKQVALTKEVAPETEVTVFTMDVRAAGKGYERYFERAAALPGVTYRRELPACIHETPEDRSLRLPTLLSPEGQGFDLAVLAVGMGPSDGVRELAACAGVDVDEVGFILQGDDGLGTTSRPGVFAVGSALAPVDVPETVTQAAAVAALAIKALHPVPSLNHAPLLRERWREKEVLDQPPHIGLFLCTCHGTLQETLDFSVLVAECRRLRAVAHVELLQNSCDGSGRHKIEQAVAEHHLNRIVIAGCSPRLYTDRFEELMDRLGLPSRLLARADIREGAAWAHAGSPAATDVARGALTMAVAGLRETAYGPIGIRLQGHTRPAPNGDTPHRVLVLGGGIAGMTAALTLADLGIACDLVEREAQLGGNLRQSLNTLEGLDARALLANTVTRVQQAKEIHVRTEAELVSWSGVRKDFAAEVRLDGEIRRERYGALIVATGARQIPPNEYLYGQHDGVLTQRELESIMDDPQSTIGNLRSVVMIQCVGSRDETHPYCSRICCAQAIKNALALKARDPATEVSILYRDMRTLGMHERYYTQARRLGVIFLQYDEDRKPLVSVSAVPGAGPSPHSVERLQVTAWDPLLDMEVTLHPDLVVLSAGVEHGADNESLARLIQVPLDEDGFFAEAHPKLRPTDMAQPGVFLCGLAYGPRFIEESITQARAAAMRAALTVARPQEPRRDIAAVVRKLCSYCGLCVTNCPYGARILDEKERFARVVDHLCYGCGICVAVCPNGASRQPALEPTQVLALVDAALIE